MALEHTTAECTGEWRLFEQAGERRIHCVRCRISHPATAEHRLAAIDENYAGIYLERLAAEGAVRLAHPCE